MKLRWHLRTGIRSDRSRVAIRQWKEYTGERNVLDFAPVAKFRFTPGVRGRPSAGLGVQEFDVNSIALKNFLLDWKFKKYQNCTAILVGGVRRTAEVTPWSGSEVRILDAETGHLMYQVAE